MTQLPAHGRITCHQCYKVSNVDFNKTVRREGDFRLTANPMAWGNVEPEVIVLGFSKGPNQIANLDRLSHEAIPYKGGRLNVGKILRFIGLLDSKDDEALKREVDQAISNQHGKFHFASLVRCTVEQYDHRATRWSGSGGDMLGGFVKTTFGQEVVSNCMTRHLKDLPSSVKLVVMFGMGTKLAYVKACFAAYQNAMAGDWRWLNEISYTDGKLVVVHVEHFTSQGALIPNWLGINDNPRSGYGSQAKASVTRALQK